MYLFLRKSDEIYDIYINIKDSKILPASNEVGVKNSFQVKNFKLVNCVLANYKKWNFLFYVWWSERIEQMNNDFNKKNKRVLILKTYFFLPYSFYLKSKKN